MVVEAGLDQCKRHPGVSCGPAPGLSGCTVNTGCLPEGVLVVFNPLIAWLLNSGGIYVQDAGYFVSCISVLCHVHLLPSLAYVLTYLVLTSK